MLTQRRPFFRYCSIINQQHWEIIINFKASVRAAYVFLLLVPVTGVVLFLPVTFLAGSHSDLLSAEAQRYVIVLAKTIMVLLPLFYSVRAYRLYMKNSASLEKFTEE